MRFYSLYGRSVGVVRMSEITTPAGGVRFINLTPHPVVIFTDNDRVKIPPSGVVIRLKEIKEKIGTVNGVPIFRKKMVAEEGAFLPPQEEGTLYIVSLPVALAFRERQDFVIPDDLVRDNEGRVIGCRALARPE